MERMATTSGSTFRSNSSQSRKRRFPRLAPAKRGICVLSIDGGANRGLLAATILKTIEEQMQTPIQEMFDILVGTSAGGLLALGFMRGLAAEDGVRTFETECQQITFPSCSNLWKLWNLTGGSAYDGSGLEQCCRQAYSLDRNHEPRMDDEHPKRNQNIDTPKVCVVATGDKKRRSDGTSTTPTFLFRNYRSDSVAPEVYDSTCKATVLDAAMATAAAPGAFPSVTMEVDGMSRTFRDGGLRHNNPCDLAILEARRQFPNQPIALVVSVGCGRNPADQAMDTLGDCCKTLPETITDTTRTHQLVESHVRLGLYGESTVYVRLDPELSPQACQVGLTDTSEAAIATLRAEAQDFITSSQITAVCQDSHRQNLSTATMSSPECPVYTALHENMRLKNRLRARRVHTSSSAVAPLQQNEHVAVEPQAKRSRKS